ncbi:MAG TPA: hypothetical protein VMT17_16025 [Anaeromyxobacteraceae bacterium]|nr:hypothetical protein [Anaeromyxobacteraceae bacterium]
MGAGPESAGRVLEQSADELRRIWRLARAASRNGVFPGLLDGVVRSFFANAGRIMAGGGQPAEAWKAASGPLRASGRLGVAELTAEWAVAMEVLAAVCESFGADPGVAEWLARAVAEAERATSALASAGELPAGMLVVHVLGDMPPPRRVLRAPVETDGDEG